MAAPLLVDIHDQEGIFQQELELLQEIFIHEIEITKDDGFPYELRLTLHPATADQTELQYVTLTIIFKISKEYPDVLPDITIRNPRGLSEEEVLSLQKRLSECATEWTGDAMLYELIMIAKESLTANNAPSCPCVICYHHFQESDEFTRTHCYHYFHSSCLGRYTSYAQQNEEEALCPVCREELRLDDSPADPLIFDDTDAPEFTPDAGLKSWQEEMAALRRKQAQKGGIIDVAANSNKFLLDISSTPSIPVIPTQADSSTTESACPTDEKPEHTAPIHRDNDHHRGRGNHQHPGRRGGRGGARGGRGRGHDRERSRRDIHHPRDSGHGAESSTQSGGSAGRGSSRPSQRGRKAETRQRGLGERHQDRRQRAGHNKGQKDPGKKLDVEEEEGGFNLYGSEGEEQRTDSGMGAFTDRSGARHMDKRQREGHDRGQKGSVKKPGVKEEEGGFNLYGSEVVGRTTNSDTGALVDRTRVGEQGVSDYGNSGKRQGRNNEDPGEQGTGTGKGTIGLQFGGGQEGVISSGENKESRGDSCRGGEDGLEKSAKQVDGGATSNQYTQCVEDRTDDQCTVKEKTSGSGTRMIGATDAKDIKCDRPDSTSSREIGLDTNVEKSTGCANMSAEKTGGQKGRPLDPEGGVRRARNSGGHGRQWRGRGRTTYGGQEKNHPNRMEKGILQEEKHNMNRTQKSTRDDKRPNGRVVTRGSSDHRDDRTVPTREYSSRGGRCVRSRGQKNDLKQTDKRTSSAVSEKKHESQAEGNDRVIHSSKRPPPGFHAKPRQPPGFEDIR